MKQVPTIALLAAILMSHAYAEELVLPPDVLAFSIEREQCDHWRGEAPYDIEREVEINVGICGSCIGTDKRLDALKAKYVQNEEVLRVLNDFEPNIEGLKGASAAKFCAATYKKYFKLQK